jgi:beta-glucosidase/6-phospho-beta-glucosidase/beta-galactosidase
MKDRPALTHPDLFRSFWMAGYESSAHINPAGVRLDMIAGVEHDRRAAADYRLLKGFNIRTARDAARWHLIDRGDGVFDFSSFAPMLRAALDTGTQVIWDLCHYGWPDDLDLFSAEFVYRFGKYSEAVARFVRKHTDQTPFYSPINEINFMVWGIGEGLLFPFVRGRDAEIKRQLARAAIASCEAIWSVDPRARITFPEPVINVLPPCSRPDLAAVAEQYRQSQFEAWDMIAGYCDPSLGGHPRYLDILGANFYHSNQWEIEGAGRLRWEDEPRDDRWRPLHQMLAEIWRRYQRPLYLAETSHFGSGRGRWIQEIGDEVCRAWAAGTPVAGVCLYPILDRYDWSDSGHWHNSGLWDIVSNRSTRLERVPNSQYAAAFLDTQNKVADCAG